MTVRTRARIILPTVQVVVAFALIVSNLRRPDSWEDPTWTKLDIQYCWALNSPAAMMAAVQRKAMYGVSHGLVNKHYPLNLSIDFSIFLSLVWLLWYTVGTEIGGKGLSVLTPKTGVRQAADVLAIALGAAVLVYADSVATQITHETLVTPVHLTWALAIIGFYGHDLWASFRVTRT